MTDLCDTEPTQIVNFENICQLVLPLVLDTICVIEAGRMSLQLMIIACNFTGIGRGYDLKARPVGGGGNEHFLRGSKTGVQRFVQAGGSEFWNITLRARQTWILEGAASAAASIAMTISSTDLVTEMVNPDGSAKCA